MEFVTTTGGACSLLDKGYRCILNQRTAGGLIGDAQTKVGL